MKKLNPILVAAVLAVVWLLVRNGLPDWNIVSPPPFKTDKLAVLVVEESLKHREYTADQLNVIQSTDARSVRATVTGKGGEFQVIDADTADDLANSPQWVREAMAVKRDSLPWVVAATPASGFSVPLPPESKLLTKIGGLK